MALISVDEEEEEEEEEDSMIDIRHRRFVYKVQSIQSPDHPTTSFHMTPQHTSSLSASSSNMMKMNEMLSQTTNEYFNDESLVPRNTELIELSVINSIQQNPVPTITFNEPERLPLLEAHPEQSNEPIQQLITSYEGQQFSDGTSVYSTDYTFNSELNTSFTISKDFETNKIDILHYDEMSSNILLQDNGKSHIQHAPLFGCTVGNLCNSAISGFDLLGTNASDNVNLEITDDHCSGQQIITGLTQDGDIIIDGLSMPISKKLDNSWQNESSMFSRMNIDEGLSISQILDDSNGQHQNVKKANSNEVVIGLTTRGEFIIANTTANSSRVNTHLVSVIMGITASGQIICGGCIADIIPESVLMTCEKTIESNENHHATFDIIGNLTAKNEKVLIGLTDSNFTNAYNGSLLRRDSF
ncbi:hypothetical protein LOAG_09894 [Loa loa]|uniref:NAGPA domain-containing protein n=1 Tax=Loa loa TaxID=7209 RepID=A0A1I7VG61_LOALO|nr:hypothetical protein LOAG_09894 [Loa loa]EFO18602.1 hypothetical protein LOAG_09894 [Loa loa]